MRIPTTVETTSPKTAAVKYKTRWLTLRPPSECTIDAARTWVFCDGSTTGWHAVVVLEPGKSVRRIARFEQSTSSANVGAELNGLILGLETVAPGSAVTFIHDYLGLSAWIIGSWKIEKPDVRKRVDRALELIRIKDLDVQFIHHPGHQRDNGAYTRWNCVADKLCGGKAALDVVEAWSPG